MGKQPLADEIAASDYYERHPSFSDEPDQIWAGVELTSIVFKARLEGSNLIIMTFKCSQGKHWVYMWNENGKSNATLLAFACAFYGLNHSTASREECTTAVAQLLYAAGHPRALPVKDEKGQVLDPSDPAISPLGIKINLRTRTRPQKGDPTKVWTDHYPTAV